MHNARLHIALITMVLSILTMTRVNAGDDNRANHSVTISIPEVALLDLEGGNSINLTPSKPDEAGQGFDFSTAVDNSIWLNYSSVVRKNSKRNVTAAITSGSIPNGLKLQVEASDYTGVGKGKFGESTGTVILTSTPQNILTNVKSCYTGTGTSNGHQLTYSLQLTNEDNYNQLLHDDNTVTITYTLTDDN